MSHLDNNGSRVSRHERYAREQRRKHGKISLLIFGLLICMVIPMLIPSDTPQINQQAVEAAVQELYLDNQFDFLNPNLTREQLEQQIKKVSSLTIDSNDPYYLKAQQAQSKFEAIEGLNTLYETETSIIEGQVVQADLRLRQDVTLDQVTAAVSEINLPEEDALSQQINQLYRDAEQTMQQVVAAQALVEQLPTELASEPDWPTLIADINEIDTLLQTIGSQPPIKTVATEFTKKVDVFATNIKEDSNHQEFDSQLVEQMFECDALARRLSGSILDERKLIALTFDDGPNPSYTPQVLDILAQYDVKATFFLLGQEVVKYPELVKEIADAGHLVENHSFGHPDFATISDDELLDEINRTQEAIYDAAGILPTMYRMPYGSGGARVVQMFPDLQSVIWNVDSEDWVSEDAYTIYLNVMENLLQHTVLLMHDKDQSTVDSLELLIPELIAQGYEFVSPLEINMEFLYYE